MRLRRLLDDRCGMDVVRRACDSGGFDDDLWAAMVEQGWTGIAVPEALGGVGLGTVEAAVLLEQTGAHLAPVPLLQQLAALAVLADGPWGERLLSGEAVACVARTPLDRAGDGSVSGRPEPVIYGARADVLVAPATATARTPMDDMVAPAGDELVAVDLAGIARSPEPAMDQTRELAWIELDAAPAVTVGGAEETAAHLGPGRGVPLGGDAGRSRDGDEPGGGVRQGPRAVRPAHRQLPGGEAPLRRHAGRRRGHALGRLPRGLGPGRGRPPTPRRLRPRPRSGAATPRCGWPSRRCRSTAASASPGRPMCTSISSGPNSTVCPLATPATTGPAWPPSCATAWQPEPASGPIRDTGASSAVEGQTLVCCGASYLLWLGACFDRVMSKPLRVRRLTDQEGRELQRIVRRGGGKTEGSVRSLAAGVGGAGVRGRQPRCL